MKNPQLEAAVAPMLESFGLELESLDVTPVGRRKIVKVTVDGDGPEGRGPLLDDITEASQAISRFLDDSTILGNSALTLEVTSRGVSKPLTSPKHYRRNAGRLLRVWLGERDLVGRIQTSDDASVTLDVDGAEQVISFGDITKAVVQIEMNKPAKATDSEDN